MIISYYLQLIEKSETHIDLQGKTMIAIQEGLSKVKINDIYTDDSKSTSLQLIIESKPKGLAMTIYDNFHVAFFEQQGKFPKFKLIVTTDILETLAYLSEKQGYKMAVNNSTIYAEADNFKVILPLLESDEEKSIKQIRSFIEETKAVACKVKLNSSQLSNVIESCMSIHEKGAELKMAQAQNKKGIQFEIVTEYGSVKEIIKAKVKWKKSIKAVKFDPSLLEDLLGCVKEKVITINVVEDKCMVIKTPDSFYSCLLL